MKSNYVGLRNKIREVYLVEPNDLGIPLLTSLYRKVNRYFKKMPFVIVIPLAFILAITLYILFGYLVVRLASMLQYGF